jgi:hypothetical protein
MYIGLHVKYPSFFSNFNETRSFSTDFRKILKISNFTKIRPVGAELFHAERRTDGRTDMTKLTVACCNFAKHLKTQTRADGHDVRAHTERSVIMWGQYRTVGYVRAHTYRAVGHYVRAMQSGRLCEGTYRAVGHYVRAIQSGRSLCEGTYRAVGHYVRAHTEGTS